MHLFRFEHRSEQVASRSAFARRLLRHTGLALAIIAAFVFAGAAVYYFFFRPGDTPWMAIHRASMILFGMGPVDGPKSGYDRVLINILALLSFVLPVVVGMIIGLPVVHRVVHQLHRPNDQDPAATELKP
jgi:hypothetical protein